MTLGPLYISAGGTAVRVGRIWVPDGLHIWWHNQGVHIFWHCRPHFMREEVDR